MEIIKILLIGSDMEYCKALSDCIAQLSKELLITLGSKETVGSENQETFQMILIEGEKKEEHQCIPHSPILLVENKSETCKDMENRIFRLYKYQNVKEMIREILIIFNQITGKSVIATGDKNCKIISVYSSSGGTGKTSVSLGLAQEFARFREKKTLYINYEEWDGTSDYFGIDGESESASIGNYLYFSNRERSIDINAFLNEEKYKVNYFRSTFGRNQLKGLNTEELGDFIKDLISTKNFEYIVIDCHNSLEEGTLWLLKNSSLIVYLVENNSMHNDKPISSRDIKVIQYMENKFKFSLEEKIIKVSNFNKELENRWDEEGILYIDEDPDSFSRVKNSSKISIERAFGRGIKSIADAIENG